MKRERILRLLLNKPDGTLTKYKIAKEAQSTRQWVIELLRKLEVDGFVSETRVTDYKGLVSFWRKVRIAPDRRDYMHKDFPALLKRTDLQYALTTYQAESLVQHYLFPSRIDLYIKEEELEKWHERITKEGLVGKGNVRLLLADEHAFHGSFERRGLNVVSLPQLIVDLFDEGGVCTEAAEMLLEKVAKDALPAK